MVSVSLVTPLLPTLTAVVYGVCVSGHALTPNLDSSVLKAGGYVALKYTGSIGSTLYGCL